MSNLIITIIGIILAAVLAIAGIFYVGPAMQAAQAKGWANAMVDQNQQILNGARAFASDNGGSPSAIGMCDLINGNYLSTWPDFLMLGPSLMSGFNLPYTPQNSVSDYGCYSINGYSNQIQRVVVQYGGNSWILIIVSPNTGLCGSPSYGFDDARNTNDPMVLMAKAFDNSASANVPAGISYTASGLPQAPGRPNVVNGATGGGSCVGHPQGITAMWTDTNGKIYDHLCFEVYNSLNSTNYLVCQFAS